MASAIHGGAPHKPRASTGALTDAADYSVCSHDRIRWMCEDCAFLRSVERGTNTQDTLHPDREKAEPVLATEDTLIPHPHAPGRYTLIKAGDPLPEGVEPVTAQRSRKAPRS